MLLPLFNQGYFLKKKFNIFSFVFKVFFNEAYIISKIQDTLKRILGLHFLKKIQKSRFLKKFGFVFLWGFCFLKPKCIFGKMGGCVLGNGNIFVEKWEIVNGGGKFRGGKNLK